MQLVIASLCCSPALAVRDDPIDASNEALREELEEPPATNADHRARGVGQGLRDPGTGELLRRMFQPLERRNAHFGWALHVGEDHGNVVESRGPGGPPPVVHAQRRSGVSGAAGVRESAGRTWTRPRERDDRGDHDASHQGPTPSVEAAH